MNEGDICLAPLPTSHGSMKLRPILLLRRMPGFGDFLNCGISTSLHQELKGFDVVLASESPEFKATGLRDTSLIRLGYLGLVPSKQIPGKIGAISSEILSAMKQRLADYLLQES